ncbi:MAG: hypothetical protein ACM3S0_16870 [Acidobacteriota bacterium]
MAGSKAAPVPDSPVQFLLTDYLVDGFFLIPEVINDKGSDFWDVREKMFGGMWLKSVTFLPTGNFAVPVQEVSKEFYVSGNTLVALIPRDPASIALALDRNSAWKYPAPAEVYAGPYRIGGNIMRKGKDSGVFDWETYLIRDAEITSVLPDSKWKGLQAPCVFVCGTHKHFIFGLA